MPAITYCELCWIERHAHRPANWRVKRTNDVLCDTCRRSEQYEEGDCEPIHQEGVADPCRQVAKAEPKDEAPIPPKENPVRRRKCPCSPNCNAEPMKGRTYAYGHKPSADDREPEPAQVQVDPLPSVKAEKLGDFLVRELTPEEYEAEQPSRYYNPIFEQLLERFKRMPVGHVLRIYVGDGKKDKADNVRECLIRYFRTHSKLTKANYAARAEVKKQQVSIRKLK